MSGRVYLALGAIVKDEGIFLDEWLAFHRRTGVERFFIYENGSSDATRELLDSQPDVVVHDWPMHPGQLPAYADLTSRHAPDAQWVAVLDADEFLFSPTGLPVSEILAHFERRGPGVVANWRMFGTGGQRDVPSEGVVRGLTRRARDDYGPNSHVKSIVQPGLVDHPVTPHTFAYRPGHTAAVGEDGRSTVGSFREPATASLLRINHYFARGEAQAQAKVARGRSDTGTRRDLIELLDPALNEIEDDRSILKTAP